MRSICFGSTALLFALAASAIQPVAAAPASSAEAERLTALLQTYVGKPAAGQPSAVVVTPEGDGYKVDVDMARAVAPFAGLGLSVTATGDLIATVTPQADGTWHVVTEGFPALALAKGQDVTTVKYDHYRFDGMFDPKTHAIKTGTSSMSGATVGSVTPEESSQESYSGHIVSEQNSEDAGDGSVNIHGRQTGTDVVYRVSVDKAGSKAAASTPAPTVTASTPTFTAEVDLSHWSMSAVLDLWAFLVAHPTRTQLAADQATFKTDLAALLASNPQASARLGGQKVVIDTPEGRFAVAATSEHVEVKGDKASQQIALGGSASGLSLPSTLVPAWSKGLVPSAFAFALTVGPVHVNEALRKAAGSADFGAAKPLDGEQANAVVQTLADPMALSITLSPTTITTPLATLKAEGSVHLGAGNLPVGTATVSMTGLDAALGSLQAGASNEPEAGQVLGVLTAMKQFAKAEGKDSYSWTIDAAPGGAISVNGTPLIAPSPPPAEQPGTSP